tara:strand:- start:1382 stop:1930 length:549 start_codon:yes stop_codon:yes gene_type:complete
MRKKLCLIIALVIGGTAYSFPKLITRTGTVQFSSETGVEKIEAVNSSCSSILKTETKVLVFSVMMRSFKFDKALMEEHFNEKYVESDTYPAAKFKGKIEDDIDFSKDGSYDSVKVVGTMDFHGVTKEMIVYANIKVDVTSNTITCVSSFLLNLEAYKIEVPSLVKDKISKDIKVSTNFIYKN